jgi:hypothetical protein
MVPIYNSGKRIIAIGFNFYDITQEKKQEKKKEQPAKRELTSKQYRI